jgi:flagellar motor component MotA
LVIGTAIISKVFVALKAAFTADTIDAPSLVEVTISLAKKSRKGGLLAQEGQHR